MMKMLKQLTWLLLPLATWVHGDERILQFDSIIEVHEDASVTVTETIRVRAELVDIRRGIYRDIRNRYRDRQGRRVEVPIDVLSVTRNGEPEDWHTETSGDSTRIYAGHADRYLQEGIHTYEFSYRTERQIGYFEDYDEIYWNATGTRWMFPIDAASATVRVPGDPGQTDLRIKGYTGAFGDSGSRYEYEVIQPGVVRFRTTQPLPPQHGLTVAVGFPKGLVSEPSATQKQLWFMRDNLGLILGGLLLAATLLWYLRAWHKVGRDPAAGVIYPRYEPPVGYSPGMLRYVWRMGYDTRTFAAALVNLAVHGALELTKEGKNYLARRLEGEPGVRSERKLRDKLLKSGQIEFKRSNHGTIRGALKAHETALSDSLEGDYFNHNRKWTVPGILMSVAAALLVVLLLPGEDKIIASVLTLFTMVWAIFSVFLVLRAFRAWRDASGPGSVAHAIGSTLLALPFTLVPLGTLLSLGVVVGWLQMAFLMFALVVNVVFYQLLKAPTPQGRELLDEIEGLRLYLGVAERDDLETAHGEEPPKTFERFEKLLPYAIALDCAKTWAERFAAEIEAAQHSGELSRRHWYGAGITAGTFSASGLTSGLSSGLSSAVSSASTAPGSSSGSVGGGFSGGGGGGGGGGGW